MYPVIRLGAVSIQTMTLAWIAALWLGTYFANREYHRRRAAGRDDVWNIVAIAAVLTVIFARLAYAAQNPSAFSNDLGQIWLPAPGTLFLEVGAFLGCSAALAFAQWQKIPLTQLLDAFAPGALFALAIVAIGQWISGDAYGTLSTQSWAMALGAPLRHPVQWYDAFAALTGWVVVSKIARTRTPRAGLLALFAVAWYSAGRLIVDAFRDESTLLAGGYRLTQVIALTILLVSLGIMSHASRPEHSEDGRSNLIQESKAP